MTTIAEWEAIVTDYRDEIIGSLEQACRKAAEDGLKGAISIYMGRSRRLYTAVSDDMFLPRTYPEGEPEEDTILLGRYMAEDADQFDPTVAVHRKIMIIQESM